MQKQKTLAASFSLKGKGLHTGLDIEITLSLIHISEPTRRV